MRHTLRIRQTYSICRPKSICHPGLAPGSIFSSRGPQLGGRDDRQEQQLKSKHKT